MNLNILNTYLVPNGELREGNRPLFAILFDSGKSNYSIYDMDRDDKYQNGLSQFRGHYFINKSGIIFKGREDNIFGEFAYDEILNRDFNVNSIGICVEGHYQSELMPDVQRNSVVLLLKYLKDKYEFLRNIYALNELVSDNKNPGVLFPLNNIIAGALNVSVENLRLAPNGLRKYAYEGRTLYYQPRKFIEGNDVDELQFILNLLGFECDLTGKYDIPTMDAVFNFQRSYNLIPDGVVAEETFKKLRDLSKKFYENRVTFNRILEVKDPNSYLYGEDVKRLQNRLNLLGYECTENGFYDVETSEAVRRFQEMHLLIPDGKAGPITFEQITSSSFVFIKRILSYSTPMLYGDDVRLVQQRLSDLGYDTPVTNWYDEATHQQIMAFQRDNGLQSNGVVDDSTAKLLFK